MMVYNRRACFVMEANAAQSWEIGQEHLKSKRIFFEASDGVIFNGLRNTEIFLCLVKTETGRLKRGKESTQRDSSCNSSARTHTQKSVERPPPSPIFVEISNESPHPGLKVFKRYLCDRGFFV